MIYKPELGEASSKRYHLYVLHLIKITKRSLHWPSAPIHTYVNASFEPRVFLYRSNMLRGFDADINESGNSHLP